MPSRCNAIAASTSEQCKRRSLPGSKYCIFHFDKNPLILSAIVGACLSIGITAAYRSVFPSTESKQLKEAQNELTIIREQLEQSNLILEKERESRAVEFANLNAKLSPFIELAQKRYPTESSDDALYRLREELSSMDKRTRDLEEDMDALREYSDVALLTFNGSQFVGGDILFNSPLTRILEGTYTQISPNRYRRVCTSESIQKYHQAINEFPRFPFSYYWLALCLRDSGNPEWQTYAESAYSIFEKTTRIAGHQSSHDEALNYLNELLGKNSTGSN